ncbi:MAG: zinc ABC transporter substrate-binding protein [Treponema sp.]|nr:zinc ABC transporter substrate-binding protein [Treponema sp.]
MKKLFLILAVFSALTTSIFAKAKKSEKTNDKIKVVTTIFPEYDWVREIAGNSKNIELTLLIGNGVDLHSYQPSFQDIAKISNADIFIYVGGESDGWVKDALKNATNKNMKVINLMETLGDKVKEEEIVEGMQAEEEEGHHHHHDGDDDEDEEEEHHHHAAAFDEKDIEDRSLSEFAGKWKSAYVWLKEGKLDHVIEHQAAEDETKTEADQRAYYETGFKTDIDDITIKGSNVTFIINGKSVSAKYEYAGYRIVNYSNGNKGVRYMYAAKGKTNGAPKYIGFNDHMIKKSEVAHYHFYSSNNSIEDMCRESDNWPTYYPANYNEEEIEEAFLGHGHSHEEEEEEEYDEHVWLSLKNAKILSTEIAAALSEKDPANEASYKANLSAYAAKLDALDAKYAAVVKAGSKKTILFGDRFPFRYLVDDYDLNYYAAFVGCSAETEASFETVIFLAKKVDELSLNTVLKIESGDGKIARTIIQNSKNKNAKVLTLDSLQSTTSKQAASGTTYLKVMEDNLKVLEEALK